MITKGIVESIVTPYAIKVRLPILNGLSDSINGLSTSYLPEATVCALPNSKSNLQVGDVVFVGFEDHDIGKPIILGHLYKETSDTSVIDLILNKLTTNGVTSLSARTSIGEVTETNIKCLKGAKFNIQAQLDDLKEKVDLLTKKLEE